LAHGSGWRVRRFNRGGPQFLLRKDERAATMTLGEFLREYGYSESFRTMYLAPVIASVWSTPPEEVLQFPMMTLFRFMHNHGLLQIFGRPQWLTVTGGRSVMPI